MSNSSSAFYEPLPSKGFYCRVCKGKHTSKDTVRQCYAEMYAKFGLSLPLQITPLEVSSSMVVGPKPDWTVTTSIPTGNYLISVDVNDRPKAVHIRIGHITTGKWNGVYVVSMFDDESKKMIPISRRTDRETIVTKLIQGNWIRMLCDYGRTFGQCPICEQPLPLEDMKLGIHGTPECYSKVYK